MKKFGYAMGLSSIFCLLSFNLVTPEFQQDELSKSIGRGKSVYEEFCMLCHMASGEGVKNTFPTLVKSDFFAQREATLRAVKFGQKGAITVNGVKYNGMMPAPGLTDGEIADVMNYVFASWGNSGHKAVTAAEVKAIAK
jgi:mono/diheme cytochrome c family protein